MAQAQVIKKGMTSNNDPAEAAKELHDAIAQDSMSLAVFFCSSEYDLDRLAKSIKTLFSGVTVIGCTTAGEIAPTGYLEGGISGFSLAASDFRVETKLFSDIENFSIPDSQSDVKGLVSQLAQESDVSSDNCFGFLLVDGSSVKEESVISSIYAGLGGLSIFGASAGDGLNFGPTYVYHDGSFHENSAVLALVNTQHQFKVFKTQHFVPSDKKLVITEAIPEKRIVTEINGEPAATEYAKVVGLQVDKLSPQIFADYPVMLKVGGSYYVRSIQQVNPDGSLTFYCAIDEGIVLTVANGEDITKNLVSTFDGVREEIGDPQLIIGSDCILRRLELVNKNLLGEVGQIMSENNVIGFNTYGEQFDAMHVNQTFTGVAIA